MARAALREGISTLPVAALEGPAREVKLLLDHREDLVGERTRIQNRLRWLLHDRWPELELPSDCLDRIVWLERLSGRLARSSQDADVRVMRHQVRRLRELVRETRALERELLVLVRGLQPRLLEIYGVSALTAAKLIAEIAGIERFRSPAKLARLAGVAPIPASSGARQRMRLHRGGNRQLNSAFHRRCHPSTRVPSCQGLRLAQARRGQDQARGRPLPQATPRSRDLHDHDLLRQRCTLSGAGLDIGATR